MPLKLSGSEGLGGEGGRDAREDTVEVGQNLVVAHAEDAVAVGPQVLGTRLVVRALGVVDGPVHLDYQALLRAAEVEHVRPESVLPAEFGAREPTPPQRAPERLFGQRRPLPKLARPGDCLRRRAPDPLSPIPVLLHRP